MERGWAIGVCLFGLAVSAADEGVHLGLCGLIRRPRFGWVVLVLG
ncbi:hypothetical protein [Acanthopleuribacter pedis]|nr:hypothetical protein [Acanthopleuribacter pedis]